MRFTYRQTSNKNVVFAEGKCANIYIYTYIYLFIDIYKYIHIWVFPKIGVPQNGWFKMENPIKIDDLWVPLFLETSIYIF